MLVDATTTVIQWEKINIALVEENALGVVLRRAQDLPGLVSRHLIDDAHRAVQRRKLHAFAKPLFRDEFPPLVREITGG